MNVVYYIKKKPKKITILDSNRLCVAVKWRIMWPLQKHAPHWSIEWSEQNCTATQWHTSLKDTVLFIWVHLTGGYY